FSQVAGRETDLEVGDTCSRDPTARSEGLERRPHGRVAQSSQYARIDEVRQRQAALRSINLAFASVSSDFLTRRSRVGAARRSASLTVSFSVRVPNSALAAARAFSSISTRRLAMARIYHIEPAYILVPSSGLQPSRSPIAWRCLFRRREMPRQ